MDERRDGDPGWRPWSDSVDEVLVRLEAGRSGLSPDEVASRLKTYGPNRLPGERRRGPFVRLLSQFTDILIVVLLAAAVVSVFLGEYLDAGVILAVVVANGVIGFVQEGRAESALEAVRRMTVSSATVMRGGRQLMIDAAELVPGDVVLLAAGDRVPADLRLFEARSLRLEEAALTGESVPVDKTTDAAAADAALGDRSSMAFSGTIVAAGRGVGLVVSTGRNTEIGKIGALLATVDKLQTPLVRQMERFGKQLTVAILGIAVVGFGFAVLVRAYSLSEAFMAMVGLVVAAIPEGLPAVMTVTLAIGVQRMARRNAVIRRMPAVETLGSVSVICTDKTGTLTRNEMTVRQVVTATGTFAVDGVGYAPEGEIRDDREKATGQCDDSLRQLVAAAVLCNDASLTKADEGWTVEGDPMEGALVALGGKAGTDVAGMREKYPRIDEIPFDASHRTMTTLHRSPEGNTVAYIKGAPEQILDLCRDQLGPEGAEPLDQDRWIRTFSELAGQGQRVLAFAARQQTESVASSRETSTFLGVVAMIDPPRSDAESAVAECQDAGIRIKMITGDHARTAAAIGGQLGFSGHQNVTTGNELDELDDGAFRATAEDAVVFARTSPEHKLRIVEALQADSQIVAMTGDGVNDAPALKRADIGIAMGQKGTEAAKDAAELVLLDDNFASIVAAIREGRTVYDNIKKVIAWTLPTSFGEGLVILAAVLAGQAMPVTPVQILWINMVTVVALGLALAFEPTEPGAMKRPPRSRNEPLLTREILWRMGFVSVCFVIGAFAMFNWALARGLDVETARTIVVNTIVVLEIFYLFNVRYLHSTSFTLTGLLGTPAVLYGVGAVVLGQLAFTYLPFMQLLFDTRPLSVFDGTAVIGVGILLLVLVEVEKKARRALNWA